MKGLCIATNDNLSQLSFDGKDVPMEGRYYNLEDASTGTAAQNKAFHSLLDAFWQWMFKMDSFQFESGTAGYDLTTPDKLKFRELFKYRYGAGPSHYKYSDENHALKEAKNMDDIPDYVVADFNSGNTNRINAVLKSWTKYGKKERQSTIDNLIMIVGISGCDDKRVHEIMDGFKT